MKALSLILLLAGLCAVQATLVYHDDSSAALDSALQDADDSMADAESLIHHLTGSGEDDVDSFLAVHTESISGDCKVPAPQDCGQAWVGGKPQGQRKCVKIDRRWVTTMIVCHFLTMRKAAQEAGTDLRLKSGFRTQKEQQYLYNCYLSKKCNNGNLAAEPGTSQHQNGIALDLTITPPNYQWLSANAARYGFIRTVSSEDWHWEFHPGKACNHRVKYSCQSPAYQPPPAGQDFTTTLNHHPAGQSDLCYVGQDKGRCMDVNSCMGKPHTGKCPGSTNIQCCVENNPTGTAAGAGANVGGGVGAGANAGGGVVQQRKCKAFNHEGHCHKSGTACDGQSFANFCPGGDMCCVKPAGHVNKLDTEANKAANNLIQAAKSEGQSSNNLASKLKAAWVNMGCFGNGGALRGACVPPQFCKDQTVVHGGQCRGGLVCCTPTRWATSDWQRELTQAASTAKKCDDGSGMPCVKNSLCRRAHRHVIPRLCMSSAADVMCCK